MERSPKLVTQKKAQKSNNTEVAYWESVIQLAVESAEFINSGGNDSDFQFHCEQLDAAINSIRGLGDAEGITLEQYEDLTKKLFKLGSIDVAPTPKKKECSDEPSLKESTDALGHLRVEDLHPQNTDVEASGESHFNVNNEDGFMFGFSTAL